MTTYEIIENKGILETGFGIVVGNKIVLWTQVDLSKKEGTFKFFDSVEELNTWSRELLGKKAE